MSETNMSTQTMLIPTNDALVGGGALGTNRLQINMIPARICGQCGNPIGLRTLCSWDSLNGEYGTNARCIFNTDGSLGGCWGHKFTPEVIAAKRGARSVKAAILSTDSKPVAPTAENKTASGPVGVNVPAVEGGAFEVLARAILPFLPTTSGVDSEAVSVIVDAKLDAVLESISDLTTRELDTAKADLKAWIEETMIRRCVIVSPNGAVTNVGVQHESFPDLLTACSARDASGHRLNVWLKGPAGSGKTRAASEVAKAFNLPFYFCGSLSEPFQLLGFTDAMGKVVRTQFREAYEHGGVFLFDEIDGSEPGAVLAFNAALSNGHCAFPDGVITRHADNLNIAAANTFGLGATDDYVGRLKQDKSSLDRFVNLDWDVDTKLELATCPDTAWCKYVQAIRANVRRLGIKVLVTPRASYYGASLLAVGMSRDLVVKMTLQKSMTADQWVSVSKGVN